jgi:hypothetical protein
MASAQFPAHQYRLRSRQKDTVASNIMSSSPESNYQPDIMDDLHLTEDHTMAFVTEPSNTEYLQTYLPTGDEGVYSLESMPTLTNHTSPVASMNDLEEFLQQSQNRHPWQEDISGAHHYNHYPEGNQSQTYLDPKQIYSSDGSYPAGPANLPELSQEAPCPIQPSSTPTIPMTSPLNAVPAGQYDEEKLYCYTCQKPFNRGTEFRYTDSHSVM